MSWIETNLKKDLSYEYISLCLDKENIPESLRAAYFLEYMRLLKVTNFDHSVLHSKLHLDQEKMFPLGDFIKVIKSEVPVDNLDDVTSILSKLNTITGREIHPIVIEELENAETLKTIGKQLKENEMVILRNTIQSYWGLSNFLSLIHLYLSIYIFFSLFFF